MHWSESCGCLVFARLTRKFQPPGQTSQIETAPDNDVRLTGNMLTTWMVVSWTPTRRMWPLTTQDDA